MISIVGTKVARDISNLALPVMNNSFVGAMEHLFLTDCNMVNGLYPYYFILMIAYAFISISWFYTVWYSTTFRAHSSAMQRGLISLPLFKFH